MTHDDLTDRFPHDSFKAGNYFLLDMDHLHDGDIERLRAAYPDLSLKDAVCAAFMSYRSDLISDTAWELIPERDNPTN